MKCGVKCGVFFNLFFTLKRVIEMTTEESRDLVPCIF